MNTINVRENRRMYNSETLTILGTQDTGRRQRNQNTTQQSTKMNILHLKTPSRTHDLLFFEGDFYVLIAIFP